MKLLAVASLLFVSTLAVPTSQCGECQKHHHPGGNNPGGNNPGGNNPGGNYPNPGGNNPGGNNPGGNNPGGNNPGGNNPGGNNPGGNNPGGNNPGGNNPGGNNPGGNNPGGNNPGNNPGTYKPCPSGLYSNPQCCATNVLGVAALDCKNPSNAPTSADDFKTACGGKQPLCCVVPVAGQSVLCVPVGGGNPGGNNPGGNQPGGNNPGGNNPGNNPGGNNPGGNNPGGNQPGGNNPGNNPGGNQPGGNNPGNNPGNYDACPSKLYSNPQCCSTNVLGVAALGCGNPKSKPTSGDNFKSTCGSEGKQALCCVLPVAGQDVLCTPATGGGNPGGNQPGGNNPGNNPGGNQPGGNNPGNNPGGNQPGGNQPGGNNPGNNPGGNQPGGNQPGGSNPGSNPDNNYKACPSGLYSNPQCCQTNVLGVAALDCANPSKKPTSGADFKATCGAKGKQASCCVIPLAGQGVLCHPASG